MKKVTFNRDFEFALDGNNMTRFCNGETHTLPSSCADSAIQEGAAMRIDVEAQPAAVKKVKEPDIIVPEVPTGELGQEKKTPKPARAKAKK